MPRDPHHAPTKLALRSLAVATLLTAATLSPAIAGAEKGGGVPALDCGDNVDLPWRCLVVNADEIPAVLELFEGACFLIDTLDVSPWAASLGADVSQVTHYVVTGREAEVPCFPEREVIDRLAERGFELRPR